MASKTAFSYSNFISKDNPVTENNRTTVTPDMHYRMSKKIAQLTKVIYSMKTKADEHDSTIEFLRNQHQQEIQAVLQEDKLKFENIHNKNLEDKQLQCKIQLLEQKIQNLEKQKQSTLNEFHEYQREIREREISHKRENSEKIFEFCRDIKSTKDAFESRLKKFNELMQKTDIDKQNNINNLNAKHINQVKEIHSTYDKILSENEQKIAALNEKQSQELQALKEKIVNLTHEHQKHIDDYELKLSKAREFYENEISAISVAQESQSHDVVRAVKANYQHLQQEYENEKIRLNERLTDVTKQLADSENERKTNAADIDKLNKKVEDSENEVLSLKEQMGKMTASIAEHCAELKESRSLLDTYQRVCDEQKEKMQTLSSQVTEYKDKNSEQVDIIKKLQKEVENYQDSLSKVSCERQELLDTQLDSHSRNVLEMEQLKQQFEKLKQEKLASDDDQERELSKLRSEHVAKETEMHKDFTSAIISLEKQYKNQMDILKETAQGDIDQLNRVMEERLNEDKTVYNDKYLEFEKEILKMKEDYTAELNASKLEAVGLKEELQEARSKYSASESNYVAMKELCEDLEKQLNLKVQQLEETKNTILSMQDELNRVNAMQLSNLMEADERLRNKIRDITVELDEKWMRKNQDDLARLENELRQKYEVERERALHDLCVKKDLELQKLVSESERKVAELEQEMREEDKKRCEEIEWLKKDWEDTGYSSAREEYLRQIELIRIEHDERIGSIHKDHLDKIQNIEATLKEENLQNLKTQMVAHRAVVESTRAQMLEEKAQEIARLKSSHFAQMNDARDVIIQQHNSEMERITSEHNNKVEAVKMELQRSADISKQRERECLIHIDELKNDIGLKEKQIASINLEVKSMSEDKEKLIEEIKKCQEEKSEICHVRDSQIQKLMEENEAAREEERQLAAKQEIVKIEKVTAEFNAVKDLLKRRVEELLVICKDWEDKYNSRESRPEDLQIIQQLHDTVRCREAEIVQLEEQKKYYKLELVNRENNFNKLFTSPSQPRFTLNAAPGKRKSKDSITSTPSFTSPRLEPLPGSIIHSEKLNRIEPLPPFNAIKKYVQ